jgi:hypothetical protein
MPQTRLAPLVLLAFALGCSDRPLPFEGLSISDMASSIGQPTFDMAFATRPCTTCAAGACGTQVSASMTAGSAPDGWSFNAPKSFASGAHYDSSHDVAVVTENVPNSVGSIFYRIPIVTDIVDIGFEARIVPAIDGHADGMAFMLVADDPSVANIPTAFGASGGGLGMAGATVPGSGKALSGVGLELDCYDNDNPQSRCGESIRGEHVNIDSLGGCPVDQWTLPAPIAAPVEMELADGQWRTVAIHIEDAKMTVSITVAGKTIVPFDEVPLPGFVNGGSYYYGFSGATGFYSERHELRNVSFSFPTPRCL